MKVINKKEAEELMQKPKGTLNINESVFVLQRKLKAIEKRIAILETRSTKVRR